MYPAWTIDEACLYPEVVLTGSHAKKGRKIPCPCFGNFWGFSAGYDRAVDKEWEAMIISR